ncbi:alpha-tocopherol transfer protein-like isoform X2 [Dermacentor silvarum]|uniref:alpha-tocopherol transfer protein-like isoform X2 n=1 Tax=Dermacentor silvarum TaxID=543639 RepID=UPI0021011428|nr:alpha-tocopherol transfer protein-like isoform X2 [Dermacentor silvarum]
MSGFYTKKCIDDVIDKSEGALPYKLQLIAEEQLGETPARRKDTLERLAQLLEEEEELNARKDGRFLLRFLRVRKYDVEAALRSVRNYYRMREVSGPIFRNFLPSKMSPATRKLVMTLPGKDVHGRCIILFKIGAWVPAESSYIEAHRAVVLSLEHLVRDPATQTLGVVMMFDYAGLTVDNVLACNVGLMRQGFEYLQIRLYGEKFDELHREISPDNLPEEYGGRAPPLDFEGYWKGLDKCEEDYRLDNSYGYIRTTRGNFATEAEMEEAVTFL